MSKAKIKLEDIAVIVATKNDAATLEACVDSLLEAGRGRSEIIIVNDASTDESVEILDRYGDRIRVLQGTGEGPGKARNLGLQSTKKRWIAFTDADCEVSSEWLERLTEGFLDQEDSFIGMGGPQKISKNAGETEVEIGRFLETVGFVSDYIHGDQEVCEVSHNPTCNVLYARHALEAVGGFDEDLWPCEDLDLDLRLRDQGFRLAFHPQAEVEHRRPESWRGFWSMMGRYGFAHAQLVKKRGLCQPLHLLPIFSPLGLLFVGGLFFYFPLISSMVLGTCVLFTFLIFLGLTKSVRRSFRYPLVLLKVLLDWQIGFARGLLGKRRVAQKNG